MTTGPVYSPISGLAAAGFGLAALFALGLAALTGLALHRGVPLLLHPLLLVMPAAALVLCLLGHWQIWRCEGTRAGTALANWGVALALLFGGGYLAWSSVKERVVQEDAGQFTSAWLDRLRPGKSSDLDTYIAFWNTLDPERRDPSLPLDTPKFEQLLRDKPEEFEQRKQNYILPRFAYGIGEKRLPAFLEHELVQFLRRADGDVHIEPKGVRSWSYRPQGEGGYLVEQNYRITTAEGAGDAVITVLGGRRGGTGPQWQVLMEATELAPPDPRQLTPLGQNVVLLRQDSRAFARDWAGKLVKGEYAEAYLDTRPAADRPALRQQSQRTPLLGAIAATASAQGAGLGPLLANLPLLDAQTGRAVSWPGYEAFASGSLVADRELLMDPANAKALGTQLRGRFGPQPERPAFLIEVVLPSARLTSPWQRQTGQVVFRQPFAMLLGRYRCEGWLLAATSAPPILTALIPGTAVKLALPAGPRPLRWRIVGLELTVGTLDQGS